MAHREGLDEPHLPPPPASFEGIDTRIRAGLDVAELQADSPVDTVCSQAPAAAAAEGVGRGEAGETRSGQVMTRLPDPEAVDLKWHLWNAIWRSANSELANDSDGTERDELLAKAAKDLERSTKHLAAVKAGNHGVVLVEALELLAGQAQVLGQMIVAGAVVGRALCLPSDARVDLASGRPTSASSEKAENRKASCAVDGNSNTRWTSIYQDGQWLSIDLGTEHSLSRVEIRWEAAYAESYLLEGSADGESWMGLAAESGHEGWVVTSLLPGTKVRFVRMHGLRRATGYGFSIWDMRVYGSDSESTAADEALSKAPPAGLTATLWRGLLGAMRVAAMAISEMILDAPGVEGRKEHFERGRLLQVDFERAWYEWAGGARPQAAGTTAPAVEHFAPAPPRGRCPWEVDVRRGEAEEAAAEALQRTSFAEAIDLLSRALLEVPQGIRRAELLVRRGHVHWRDARHAAALKDFNEAEQLAGATHGDGTSPSLLALRYCMGEDLKGDEISGHTELKRLLQQLVDRRRKMMDDFGRQRRLFFPRSEDPVKERSDGKPVMTSGMRVFDGKCTVPGHGPYPSAQIGYRLFVHQEKGPEGAPLFVYHHGNGETVCDYTGLVGLFATLPCSLLVFDYRGYGWSTGEPALAGLNADAEECVRQLPQLLAGHGLPWPWPSPMILVGRSMGGPVAAGLALKFPEMFEGLILESSTSNSKEEFWQQWLSAAGPAAAELHAKMAAIRVTVEDSLPPGCQLGEELLSPLGTSDMLAGYRGSVLVLHGSLDWIVPPENGQRHYEAASRACERVHVVVEADHNTCAIDKDFWRSQMEFVRKVSSRWHGVREQSSRAQDRPMELWSIAELKAMAQKLGVSIQGCSEKADLVELLQKKGLH